MSCTVTTVCLGKTRGKILPGIHNTSTARRESSYDKRNCVQPYGNGHLMRTSYQFSGNASSPPVSTWLEYKIQELPLAPPFAVSFLSSWMTCQAYHSTPVFVSLFARVASIPMSMGKV